MAMQEIGKFSLHNGGGFVTRGEVAYLDDNGEKHLSGNAGDITLGRTGEVDPAKLGVPDGSIVSLYAFVVWGNDNEARQSFIYKQGSVVTASYTITGTTLANTLGLISVSCRSGPLRRNARCDVGDVGPEPLRGDELG